ncbi:MAG: dolichyl-phosphate beta-D-mannosyltransferase [Chryseobacterium indoltheticum]|jgi:dolichol-phosphate mannosyltransferase|nr:dolichyl-phosphate beta-D-mannosyltransferase [Chryseobacterium indoltheticum]
MYKKRQPIRIKTTQSLFSGILTSFLKFSNIGNAIFFAKLSIILFKIKSLNKLSLQIEMKKLVIIPTYNEKENIENIISAVFALEEEFHILVVDDSSPDKTADLVKELQKKFPHTIHLSIRHIKDGLGKAYIHGFKWALQNNYDYIFEMDADFSHDPKDLPKLFEACKNADMAVGSRYSKGVNVVNWPMGRVLLSYFASKYVRFILGLPIHDTTAGFVCFSRKVLDEIGLDNVRLKGYGFQIEMKFRAFKKGFKIVEVPIIFTNRILGESKMNGGIIHEAVFGVLNLKWKSIIKRL